MADPEDIAVWPGSPYALADTTLCPACFQRLEDTTCRHCGLVLADTRAHRLLELGDEILALEVERQRVIDEIRAAHRPAPAAVESTVWRDVPHVPGGVPVAEPIDERMPMPAAVDEPVVALVAVEASAAGTAAPPLPPFPLRPAEPEFVAPKPRRPRLTVPVLLLIVGVSLVGVAAIFFLGVAWFVAGIAVRALIIGAITLATIAAASLLRRRELTATAEAIAVLGVVLLALDAWAVRANDLFGAGESDPVVYGGAATLVVGVLCRAWAFLSKLRSPDIAATLALPAGLGLLIAGLVPLEGATAVTAGLLGATAGGLAHALPAPWSAAHEGGGAANERAALAAIGIGALVVATAITLTLGADTVLAQGIVGALIVGLGAAHALLLRARDDAAGLPGATALGATAAAVAAVAAATLGWQLAEVAALPIMAGLIAPVIAVVVAVGLDRWRPHGISVMAARIVTAIVGAVSIGAVMLTSAARAGMAISYDWMPWSTAPFAAAYEADPADAIFSLIAAALIAGALFLAPTLDRPRLRGVRPIVAAVIVIAAAAGTTVPAIAVAGGVAVAGIALVALARHGHRPGWGAASGIGAVSAYLFGLASPGLWIVGVVVAVAVPIAARLIVRPNSQAAVMLAIASVAVATVSALLAPAAIASALSVDADERAIAVLLQWVAVVVLATAVIVRIDTATRSALAVCAYVLTVFSLLMFVSEHASTGTVSSVLGEPVAGIVRGGLLVGLLVLVAVGRTRVDPQPAIAASALVAPAAAITVAAVVDAVDAAAGPGLLAVISAAVLVTVVGVVVPLRAQPLVAVAPRAVEAEMAPSAASVHDFSPAALPVLDRPRTAFAVLSRRYADLGALATTVAVAWAVPGEYHWAMYALVAVGFVAASVTRGWAALRIAGVEGFQIGTDGAPLERAPRRLLVWPGFAAATLALLSGLAPTGALEVEVYLVPPAVGLLVFATVLVWLRRHVEATVAITLSFALGLILPAFAGMNGPPIRGTVVALVSAALAVVLAWSPLRRAVGPALAGASTALVALSFVAVERAIFAPAEPAWLLLLVAGSYAAAFGFVQAVRTDLIWAADPPAWFAMLVPPLAVVVAVLGAWPSFDEPLVLGVSLAVLGALHLSAAALHRLPLGAATRWTAFAAAAVIVVGRSLGTVPVEQLTLPLAGMLLGGAALALWRHSRERRRWLDGEQLVWLAGLALAVLPSIAAAAPTGIRSWLVISVALTAAVVCAISRVPGADRLRAPSAMVLTGGAVLMGARAVIESAFPSAEAAALVAGLGAIVVAAILVWIRESDAAAPGSTALAGSGMILLILTVSATADGGIERTVTTVIASGVIGVGGALLLGSRKWRGIGGILAGGAVFTAVGAAGTRFLLLLTMGLAGVELDFWALTGLGIVTAIGLTALRANASRTVALIVGAVFAMAVAIFALAELLLLGIGDDPVDAIRSMLTVSALTAVGVVGVWHRRRLGSALAVTAAVAVVIFGLAALFAYDVRPIELFTAAPALGLIVLGTRRLRQDSAARTWPALGPGIALLTLPSLAYDFGGSDLWRVVALGAVAIALVVVGAVFRLQAPLVLGAAVLLVHAVAQLWPWISSVYVAVPWWLWLGVGGALLIYIAARYEKRMRALRAAFTAVTSLR